MGAGASQSQEYPGNLGEGWGSCMDLRLVGLSSPMVSQNQANMVTQGCSKRTIVTVLDLALPLTQLCDTGQVISPHYVLVFLSRKLS